MTPQKLRPPAKRAAPSATAKAPRSPRGTDALHAEIARLRAALDAFERDRAELCSALSHDLRNPLTVVVWSSQLLARRLPQDETARRQLDSVARAAEEMNQMLHELSDAARIPSGRLPLALELSEGEVGELAEQAARVNRAAAQSKELTITLDLPRDVGTITCDRERVTRVLTALISGAVRRSPKVGAVRVQASRGVSSGQEEVLIAVEDGGPDIPAEDREAIFDLPTVPPVGAPRRPRPWGSAITLFVARGVVEAHGGRLWLESEPGRGARLVVTLPALAPPSYLRNARERSAT